LNSKFRLNDKKKNRIKKKKGGGYLGRGNHFRATSFSSPLSSAHCPVFPTRVRQPVAYRAGPLAICSSSRAFPLYVLTRYPWALSPHWFMGPAVQGGSPAGARTDSPFGAPTGGPLLSSRRSCNWLRVCRRPRRSRVVGAALAWSSRLLGPWGDYQVLLPLSPRLYLWLVTPRYLSPSRRSLTETDEDGSEEEVRRGVL
jgi:hypothetical protein